VSHPTNPIISQNLAPEVRLPTLSRSSTRFIVRSTFSLRESSIS
jgi:hypothetical protein